MIMYIILLLMRQIVLIEKFCKIEVQEKDSYYITLE